MEWNGSEQIVFSRNYHIKSSFFGWNLKNKIMRLKEEAEQIVYNHYDPKKTEP